MVMIYFDDILIVGKGTYQEHMDEVISRLRCKGMQFNLNKCSFAKDSVEYLGFIISRKGIKLMPQKIQKMIAIKSPKNKKQL